MLVPTTDDLNHLSEILCLFAGALGLVTIFDKCAITLINCDEDMLATVLQVFPCAVQLFSYKYLGFPLSLRRLNRAAGQPLVAP